MPGSRPTPLDTAQGRRPRPDDEAALTADIVALALQYGRYGYRRITALLRAPAGREPEAGRTDLATGGAEGPDEQPKRGRLWLNDGSCVRLRPERPNHVWSYDFVEDRTHDGRKFRMLNVIDEFTRECLAIRIGEAQATDVIDVLSDLFILRGMPGHVRSDNGPEFIAKAVRDWIAAVGSQNRVHRAGQSLGERLLRELQRAASGRTPQRRDLLHARRGQIVIERWRRHYNTVRPHSSLGDRPPAPRSRYGRLRTPTSSAGNPDGRVSAVHELTLPSDPLMGAGQAELRDQARLQRRRGTGDACLAREPVRRSVLGFCYARYERP